MMECAEQYCEGDDVRVRTLRAARELIEETGFEALNLRMIAARAKAGLASIYHHFESKDDLFLQVALGGFADLHKAMHDAGQSADMFRDVSNAYLEFAQARAPLYRLMYDERLLAHYPALHRAERETLAVFEHYVERGGRFPGAYSSSIAWTLYAFGRGLSALASSCPGGRLPPEQWAIFRTGLEYLLQPPKNFPDSADTPT